MHKKEFLDRLQQGLSQLPAAEQKNQLEYYEEMIADRMEDGMTEQEALEKLGDPDRIARQILEDQPLSTLVKTRIQPKKGWTTPAVVLAILGAPLWAPLAIGAVSVVGSLCITVWALLLSFYLMTASLGLGGLAGVLGSFTLFGEGIGSVLTAMGLGLISAALCCLGIPAAWYLTKALIRGTGWTFHKIKTLFIQ